MDTAGCYPAAIGQVTIVQGAHTAALGVRRPFPVWPRREEGWFAAWLSDRLCCY
jgi:hypothetical protein